MYAQGAKNMKRNVVYGCGQKQMNWLLYSKYSNQIPGVSLCRSLRIFNPNEYAGECFKWSAAFSGAYAVGAYWDNFS